MRSQSRWIYGLFLAGLLAGCGESAPPPEETEQGAEARRIVLAFVEKARRAPAAAPSDLNILMESLDAYTENASGEHGPTYVKIRDTAKELQDLYARKAPAAEIQAKLDQLAQLAQTLPGDAPGS